MRLQPKIFYARRAVHCRVLPERGNAAGYGGEAVHVKNFNGNACKK